MRAGYVPGRGDVVWIGLDPQSGHEQAGRRPALVVSPAVYKKKAGLALFCPITGQVFSLPGMWSMSKFTLPDTSASAR